VDSIVSAGCIIGGGTVVKSILSPGVTIQKDALVEESILFPNVTIGPGAKVRRAIVEKGLHIPAGFQIGYDLERDKKLFHVTESGIVVLAKDTIIKA
jgi:glucose-1-phosphate adenylyltransferase